MRDIGRLVLRRVLAGGLAERRGAGLGSRARRRPPGTRGRRSSRSGRAARARPASSSRRSARRATTAARISAPVLWMCMNSSSGSVSGLPTARQVDRLAAGHAARAAGDRERCFSISSCAARVVGEPLFAPASWNASDCSASPDEQRGGLVELDVARRLAAAQHVVVHARQVVVHQRIGVDQLDRAGRRLRAAPASRRGQLARGEREQRAHALAAAEHRVAHRACRRCGRDLRRGQEALPARLRCAPGSLAIQAAKSLVWFAAPGKVLRVSSSSTCTCCWACASSVWQYCASSRPRLCAASDCSSESCPDSMLGDELLQLGQRGFEARCGSALADFGMKGWSGCRNAEKGVKVTDLRRCGQIRRIAELRDPVAPARVCG